MDKKPIILHIAQLLEDFDEMPLRAIYMVVKQYHDLLATLRQT